MVARQADLPPQQPRYGSRKRRAARSGLGWFSALALVLGLHMGCGPRAMTPIKPATSGTAGSETSSAPAQGVAEQTDSDCGPKGLATPLLDVPLMKTIDSDFYLPMTSGMHRYDGEPVFRPHRFRESFTDRLSQWHIPTQQLYYEPGELRPAAELQRSLPLVAGWLVGSAGGLVAVLTKDHRALLLKDGLTGETKASSKILMGSEQFEITTAAVGSGRVYLGDARNAVVDVSFNEAATAEPLDDPAHTLRIAGETLEQFWADGESLVQVHSGSNSPGRVCTDVVAAPVGGSARVHVAQGYVGTCGELLDSGRMLFLSNSPARAWVVDTKSRRSEKLESLPLDVVSCGSIRDGQIVLTGRRGDRALVAVHTQGGWRAIPLGPVSGQLPVSVSSNWIAVGDPTVGVVERGRLLHSAGLVHLLEISAQGVRLVKQIAAQNPTAASLFGRQVVLDSDRLYIGEAGSHWYPDSGGTDPAVSVYALKSQWLPSSAAGAP